MDGMLPGGASADERDAPGSESDASSVSNNLHDNEVIPLYISREEIDKNSPSRRDGIDLKMENSLRMSYCTFLNHLGEKLKAYQVTIDTAIVLCHRFFLRQSHAKNDRRTIATACMILAGKVDEVPQALEDVIVVSYEIIHKKELDASQRKEVYEQQKELVLSGEKLVLSTLNFDLMVYLPYKHLLEAIKKYIAEEDKQIFTQVAWNLLNDSFRTTLCLQYEPHHIASGVFFHTSDLQGTDLQSHGEGMCQALNITSGQVKDIIGQIRELYVEKPVPGPIAERSNGGDIVHQPVSRDMASSSDIEGGSAEVNLSQGDEYSVCYVSIPEDIEKDNAESEAGENQDDDDHSVPNITDETSDDDDGVSQLEKDLQVPPEEEVKANVEKDEKPSDKGIEKRDAMDENDLSEREVEDAEDIEIVDANQSGVDGELMADDPLMNDNDLEEMDNEGGDDEDGGNEDGDDEDGGNEDGGDEDGDSEDSRMGGDSLDLVRSFGRRVLGMEKSL